MRDAHLHLQQLSAPELMPVLQGAGITGGIINGTSPTDWPTVAQLAATLPGYRPAFGLHPWHVGAGPKDWRETLAELLKRHPRASVGEIGLDRWILDQARPDDPRLAGLPRADLSTQIAACRDQLELARQFERPATLHCLQAWGPLDELVRSMPPLPRGFLLHAYGGPTEMVSGWVRLGAYFSFNAYFTHPRHVRQLATFRDIPADRLLVETDAPAMMPPADYREFQLPDATQNHPANLRAAYRALAELRGCALAELIPQVGQNFRRLFGD